MGNIISGDDLIQKPHDKFWDSPPTRREMQKVFNKLGANDSEMMGMCDTAALVLNFLCERLKISREELDEYVVRKAAEVEAMRAKARAAAAQETQQNAKPNG